ncbi:MAG TPA: hypothetical protein VNR38_12110 [Ureibacillus sp.]|nr:hypothetical protein [Ureibacillus sp.]
MILIVGMMTEVGILGQDYVFGEVQSICGITIYSKWIGQRKGDWDANLPYFII